MTAFAIFRAPVTEDVFRLARAIEVAVEAEADAGIAISADDPRSAIAQTDTRILRMGHWNTCIWISPNCSR